MTKMRLKEIIKLALNSVIHALHQNAGCASVYNIALHNLLIGRAVSHTMFDPHISTVFPVSRLALNTSSLAVRVITG